MNIINVSITELWNAAQFKEQVLSTFSSSVPPVGFSFQERDAVKRFATIFKPEQRGYFGKKISCKHADINVPANYAVSDIVAFTEDKYPIELHFKNVQDVEDFAIGFLRVLETAPAPKPKPTPVPPVADKETPPQTERVAAPQPKQEERRVYTEVRERDRRRRDEYPVNPAAETLLDTLIKIQTFFAWLLAIVALIVFVAMALNTHQYFFILIGVLVAALILLLYYVIWAVNKVVLNISRNLFNIREDLKELKK